MNASAKIMLLGDIAVGKTSLAKRLVFNRFDSDYKTTIGVNVLSHEVHLDEPDETVRLVIWDTDGDFSQAIFNTTYIVGASGAIVVADATRRATVDKMATLVEMFENRYPGRPVRAVLNKIDLATDALQRDLPQKLPSHLIVRTSALTGEGVAETFKSLANAIRRRGL